MSSRGAVKGQRIVIQRGSASDARGVAGPVAIETAIAVLDAALRVVRVDLSELDFSQDDAGQPLEDLFHPFTGECRNFDGHWDIRLCRPARRILSADLSTLSKGSGHPGSGAQVAG